MAKIIRTDGTEISIEPKNGKDFKLNELQPIVGGYIEIVHIEGDNLMVVNEEGKLERLPLNVKATELARQVIVGDVLVCNKRMIQ